MYGVMARGKLTFRQSDLTRALKAARAAGVEVARVEVDATGKITIVTGKAPETAGDDRGGDQWDAALK